MGIYEIFLIGLGLAMDAFAVAVCKGLSIKKIDIKKSTIIALWFGSFQAIMPVIGYFLGNVFKDAISTLNHLIAFILLTIIGFNMLKSVYSNKESSADDNIGNKQMFLLALATSIDALTVGVTLAFFNTNILISALMIGVITFILSFIGVKIGNKFGDKYEKKAQVIGGGILVCLGIKNLLDYFS